MAGRSRGRGARPSEATGARSVLSAPGLRWGRLGLRLGHPGLQGPSQIAERGERVLDWAPAWAPCTPERLELRG